MANSRLPSDFGSNPFFNQFGGGGQDKRSPGAQVIGTPGRGVSDALRTLELQTQEQMNRMSRTTGDPENALVQQEEFKIFSQVANGLVRQARSIGLSREDEEVATSIERRVNPGQVVLGQNEILFDDAGRVIAEGNAPPLSDFQVRMSVLDDPEASDAAKAQAAEFDIFEASERAAGSLKKLLDSGNNPDAIASHFNTLADQAVIPQQAEVFRGMANVAGEASEIRGMREGREKIAAAEPLIQRLVELGVDPQLAGLSVLGNTSLEASLMDPEMLTSQQRIKLVADRATARLSIKTLKDVIPLIDEDVIGIAGAVNEKFSPVSQLPIVKDVVPVLIGMFINGRPLTAPAIRKAHLIRSRLRLAFAQLRPFLTNATTGRPSNLQFQLAEKQTLFFEPGADLATVIASARSLLRFAQDMEINLDAQITQNTATPSPEDAGEVGQPSGLKRVKFEVKDGKLVKVEEGKADTTPDVSNRGTGNAAP